MDFFGSFKWRNFGMVNVSANGEVYRCEVCGNVVVVKEAGGGEIMCHGQPMKLESTPPGK